MTIQALGQLLGNVIQSYMGLDASRVVLADEGFDAPKDQGIYVLVIYDGTEGLLGVSRSVDSVTGLETMSTSTHERFQVEVISRGRDATNRHKEVLFAIESTMGIQSAESNGVSFFRGGQVLDLSAIEGSGALRRYRIPVIISNVETKTSAISVPLIAPSPIAILETGKIITEA